MVSHDVPLQFLLTLPPRMAAEFESLEERKRPQWFACSDSSGPPLGSGGGTANLLIEAWRQTANGKNFSPWLQSSRKLMLHSGGQSRRLPAYAPLGKLLMPVPVLRWSRGQRLDQSLLDLALPDYSRVLAHGGKKTVAMLVSGDTLIRMPAELPEFPDVELYVHCLRQRLLGATLLGLTIRDPFVLRTVQPGPAAFAGLSISGVSRLGKRIVLEFPGPRFVVVHLMVAGRFRWQPPSKKASAGLAAWEFEAGNLLLTEAGTKRRAKIHLLEGAEELARRFAQAPAKLSVGNRLSEIFQKLNVTNRTQAALVAVQRGLLPPPTSTSDDETLPRNHLEI